MAEKREMCWDDKNLTDGRGQRVCRDLVKQLSENLFQLLSKDCGILNEFGRRPRERWLYGYISRSLGQIIEPDDFLLTETPIGREGGNGRVDFLFSYRNWLFMMELKATGCRAQGGSGVRKEVMTHWYNEEEPAKGAVSQLRQLELEDVRHARCIAGRRKLNGVIMLPVLLCSYYMTSRAEDDGDQLEEKIEELTADELRNRHDEVKEVIGKWEMAAFNDLRDDDRLLTCPGKNVPWTATVGYGLIAGDKRLNEVWLPEY